jgi:hypothetical protein
LLLVEQVVLAQQVPMPMVCFIYCNLFDCIFAAGSSILSPCSCFGVVRAQPQWLLPLRRRRWGRRRLQPQRQCGPCSTTCCSLVHRRLRETPPQPPARHSRQPPRGVVVWTGTASSGGVEQTLSRPVFRLHSHSVPADFAPIARAENLCFEV